MTPRQYAESILRFTRSISDGFLKGWPEDKLAFQNCAADNHPIWVVGHIACTDAWIASAVGISGITAPESYAKLFGQGSKPSSNAADYPPYAELLALYTQNREKLLAWLDSASDDQLTRSLKESTSGFANDVIDALLKSAWHEGWHFGQVATLRKSLGLPPVMG